MTLFKQLALVISFILVVMLSAVMYINYESAKKNMIESLYETTVNNISTLANNLSEAAKDTALLTTVIDAEFDSGYYKLIRFTSSDKLFTYEQIDNEQIEDVPAWFVNFTNIKTQIIKTDISSGWNTVGEVEVAGDTAIVYKALYKMFIKLLYLFLIITIFSHIILSILLHFVLKPLKNIQNQAEAIIKNEFVIQKDIPYTTEFKNVVKAMNGMVKKIEDIFNKANEAAKRNSELLYKDSVSKLYNRRYFMLKLPDLIRLENSNNGGTIIFVAFSSLEIINKLIGHKNSDDMFERFANKITNLTLTYNDKIISRVNEIEFMLILSNCEIAEATSIANNINKIFNKLLIAYEIDKKQLNLNIGLCRYRPNITVAQLLTQADNALAKAKADENNNIYIYEELDKEVAMGKEQWRSIIENAIIHKHFSLKFRLMINTQTKNIDHKIMTFTINYAEDKHYFYGDFIAPAINLGLISKMYMVVLRDLMTDTQNELKESICCVRLSNELLKDIGAFKELSLLLEQYAKNINFTLCFEITDSFVVNNIELIKSFIDLLNKYEISFGINSFTGESSDFSYLKRLNPKFIKANVSFLLDQSKESMSALQVVTDSLGIDIIATLVKTRDELDSLSSMHIYKVQGPITEKI